MDDRINEPQEGPFLSHVLQAVAAGEFLTTAELGRLLLLTSKEMTAAAFSTEDEVWEVLCTSHWSAPYGTAISRATPDWSAEQRFRALGPSRRPPPTVVAPRALQFTPADYLILLSVRIRDENQEILGKVIPGEQIPEFFETGYSLPSTLLAPNSTP